MSERNRTGIPLSAILGEEPASVTVPVVDDLGLNIENVVGSVTLSNEQAESIATRLSNHCEIRLHAAIEREGSGNLKLKSVQFKPVEAREWDEGGGYR